MNIHTPLTAINAMRRIFEENQDLPFEARWNLAKNSRAHAWFTIFSRKCVRLLLVACLPILVLLIIVVNKYPDGRPLDLGFRNLGDTSIVFGMMAYVAIAFVVVWRLGIKEANRQMTQSATVIEEHRV
jgi:hypothetical protein